MDKITRILILYSSLINGEEINKTIFCFENDCSPRSFDRDIEDVRLFLSESFSILELSYNRMNNTYYIKGAKKQQLEVMEYLFIEKILQNTSVLRDDELGILKSHLLMNTTDTQKMLYSRNKKYELYKPPDHNKALLKMHGDLELTIRNHKYIRVVHQDENGIKHERNSIPCDIKYEFGYLYFVGYTETERKITDIRLDRIYSFDILRDQTVSERKRVDMYITSWHDNKLLKTRGNLVEITLNCTEEDYKVLSAMFDNVEVVQQTANLIEIKLEINEEDFIGWYLSNLYSTVTIVRPQHIKDRLVMQAKGILEKYGGKE